MEVCVDVSLCSVLDEMERSMFKSAEGKYLGWLLRIFSDHDLRDTRLFVIVPTPKKVNRPWKCQYDYTFGKAANSEAVLMQ